MAYDVTHSAVMFIQLHDVT